MREASQFKHDNCKIYYEISNKLIKVVEQSTLGLCKKCNEISPAVPGALKGDACTHMTCRKCNLKICYICLKDENEIDYDKKQISKIFGHNNDWKQNNKRCPMYITQFNEIDNSWPTSDTECVGKLFNYKLKFYTEKVINKYGIAKVKVAYNLFKNKNNKLSFLPELVIDESVGFKKLNYIDNRIISIN